MLLKHCSSSQNDTWHTPTEYLFQAEIQNNYFINDQITFVNIIVTQLQTSKAVSKPSLGHRVQKA